MVTLKEVPRRFRRCFTCLGKVCACGVDLVLEALFPQGILVKGRDGVAINGVANMDDVGGLELFQNTEEDRFGFGVNELPVRVPVDEASDEGVFDRRTPAKGSSKMPSRRPKVKPQRRLRLSRCRRGRSWRGRTTVWRRKERP